MHLSYCVSLIDLLVVLRAFSRSRVETWTLSSQNTNRKHGIKHLTFQAQWLSITAVPFEKAPCLDGIHPESRGNKHELLVSQGIEHLKIFKVFHHLDIFYMKETNRRESKGKDKSASSNSSRAISTDLAKILRASSSVPFSTILNV